MLETMLIPPIFSKDEKTWIYQIRNGKNDSRIISIKHPNYTNKLYVEEFRKDLDKILNYERAIQN